MKSKTTKEGPRTGTCFVKSTRGVPNMVLILLMALFTFSINAGAQRIAPQYRPPTPQYRPPPSPPVVSVRILPQPRDPARPRYEAYEKGGRVIYSGNDVPKLVQKVNTYAGSKADRVYLHVDDSPNISKTDAFLTSVRIQQSQINSNLALRFIIDRERSPSWEGFFFSPGVRLEQDSFVGSYQLNDGPHAGLFYSAFTVSNEHGRGRIRVFARTMEIVQAFIEAVRRLFESEDLSRMSVEQIVSSVRAKVKATHGLSEQDLEIQVGRTVVSQIWKGYRMNLG